MAPNKQREWDFIQEAFILTGEIVLEPIKNMLVEQWLDPPIQYLTHVCAPLDY